MRLPVLALALPALLLGATACAPEDEENTGSDASSPSPSGDECATDQLPLKEEGQLTVATDSPAYPPWFIDDDPTNGKGFESALVYEVADRMGFSDDQVEWVKVRFNNSYKPGPKDFDFDANQVSITPVRQETVDFSDPYYSAAQGVIALKGSDVAEAQSIEDLAEFKLGAQTGTTSLTAIRDVIQPDEEPLVFQDTNAAKQALQNNQVDAILADVPTAHIIVATEITEGTLVGQFQPMTGEQEQFGLLFEKGSELVPCVNQALAEMKSDGTLADLEERWLSNVADVPVLE